MSDVLILIGVVLVPCLLIALGLYMENITRI